MTDESVRLVLAKDGEPKPKWHFTAAEIVTEKVLTDPPQYVRTMRRMTDEAHRAKYPNELDKFIASLERTE